MTDTETPPPDRPFLRRLLRRSWRAVSGVYGLAFLGWTTGVAGLLLAGWAARAWWSPVWRWIEDWWPIPAAVVLLILSMAMLTLRARRFAPRTNAEETENEVMRALTSKAIAVGAAVLLGVGIVAAVVLLNVFGSADPSRQLDAIRTAGTIVVGTGGAAALLLAARRQRSAELTLAHQQRVADDAKYDATQRRITEIFVKAVEQLGSDKAAMRHGGLYSLERVAQDHPEQRQTVVNVICAYLRGPFTPPEDDDDGVVTPTRGPRKLGVRRPLVAGRPVRATASNAAEPPKEEPSVFVVEKKEERREQREEQEVRIAAQRILSRHLRQLYPQDEEVTFWGGVVLNLQNATLIDVDFSHCRMEEVAFYDAEFLGSVDFSFAKFGDIASFMGVKFGGRTDFAYVNFGKNFSFFAVEFAEDVIFHSGKFYGEVEFHDVDFGGVVDFKESKWEGKVEFKNCRFKADVKFCGIDFGDMVDFSETHFSSGVDFSEARFGGEVDLAAAVFEQGVPVELARFVTESNPAGPSVEQQLESGSESGKG